MKRAYCKPLSLSIGAVSFERKNLLESTNALSILVFCFYEAAECRLHLNGFKIIRPAAKLMKDHGPVELKVVCKIWTMSSTSDITGGQPAVGNSTCICSKIIRSNVATCHKTFWTDFTADVSKCAYNLKFNDCSYHCFWLRICRDESKPFKTSATGRCLAYHTESIKRTNSYGDRSTSSSEVRNFYCQPSSIAS